MIHDEFRIDLKSSFSYQIIFKELIIHQEGVRYVQRQPPIWMQINVQSGKCWCGKPKEKFDKFMRKYCCNRHGSWWYWHINAYWGGFRTEIIRADNYICFECGYESEHNLHGETRFDVDHIIAISLGGMCYDVANVRILCETCHKKKTKEDRGKLSWQQKSDGTMKLEGLVEFQ